MAAQMERQGGHVCSAAALGSGQPGFEAWLWAPRCAASRELSSQGLEAGTVGVRESVAQSRPLRHVRCRTGAGKQ